MTIKIQDLEPLEVLKEEEEELRLSTKRKSNDNNVEKNHKTPRQKPSAAKDQRHKQFLRG